MDNVAKLLNDISRLPELASLDKWASGFLNDVAEIYERHGQGATKAFLLTQQSRRAVEARLLLKLLDLFEGCPEIRVNRAIGRQIIKCLFELKGGARR